MTNDLLKELEQIKKQEEEKQSNDLLFQTLQHLISIEKSAMYGVNRQRKKQIDDVILNALPRYKKEFCDVDSES